MILYFLKCEMVLIFFTCNSRYEYYDKVFTLDVLLYQSDILQHCYFKLHPMKWDSLIKKNLNWGNALVLFKSILRMIMVVKKKSWLLLPCLALFYKIFFQACAIFFTLIMNIKQERERESERRCWKAREKTLAHYDPMNDSSPWTTQK